MKRSFIAVATAAFAATIAMAILPAASRADVPSNMQAGSSHRAPAVVNLQAQTGGYGKITLTWTNSTAAGYPVVSVSIHRTSPHGKTESVKLGAVQRWSDSNANKGVPYHYAVCATDASHETGCAYANFTLGVTGGP